MLDYTELKDKGGLEPWPPMKELDFIKVLDGDPVHSGPTRRQDPARV